ncbi:unnamed protein product [Discula destructiva]
MEKISKACEPCRRRKIRCDGNTPCNRCERHPEDCSYRLRARVRRTAVQRAAAVSQTGNDLLQLRAPPVGPAARTSSPSSVGKRKAEDARPRSNPAYSNVYQSVAAVPKQGTCKDWPENSRLFYGPASQFAFLQQVHRGIMSSGPAGQADREVQEGGAGLDLFLQRSFFFGTASRVDTSTLLRPASTLFPEVPIEQARVFLEYFRVWSSHLLPFFTKTELDQMLENLYSTDEHAQSGPSQTKALTFAVLASGALGTSHTDTAEMLLARAKYEAVPFDDTVSLQMIQFSMLIADYHTNLGRPNLVYLSLGTACRKAFAMGLHREAANCLTRLEHRQKHRTTLWSLYSMETWYSMTVGREASLKMAEISIPFPDDQEHLVSISRLAHVAEKLRTTIYTERYDSLRKLYRAAEAIHAQLREFAEMHGIGGAQDTDGATSLEPTSLIFYNFFYYCVLLAYRPFMVADFALALSQGDHSVGGGGADAMWLRQACRTAVDSAQDHILYAHKHMQKHDLCRRSRYNCFFFESNCAVLFFDILRHPSKYTYNVEYINMALQSMDSMIDDEPVTNARNSVRQILRVVEETISKTKASGSTAAPDVSALTDPLLSQHVSLLSRASFTGRDQAAGQQPDAYKGTALPWLHAAEQRLIYFPDLGGDFVTGGALPVPGQAIHGEAGGDAMDPLLRFHYDVMATDLYSFFPLDMSPPSATGHSGESVEGEVRQTN